jgi:hypothetical protein
LGLRWWGRVQSRRHAIPIFLLGFAVLLCGVALLILSHGSWTRTLGGGVAIVGVTLLGVTVTHWAIVFPILCLALALRVYWVLYIQIVRTAGEWQYWRIALEYLLLLVLACLVTLRFVSKSWISRLDAYVLVAGAIGLALTFVLVLNPWPMRIATAILVIAWLRNRVMKRRSNKGKLETRGLTEIGLNN